MKRHIDCFHPERISRESPALFAGRLRTRIEWFIETSFWLLQKDSCLTAERSPWGRHETGGPRTPRFARSGPDRRLVAFRVRIAEALAMSEGDLERTRGTILVRQGESQASVHPGIVN